MSAVIVPASELARRRDERARRQRAEAEARWSVLASLLDVDKDEAPVAPAMETETGNAA